MSRAPMDLTAALVLLHEKIAYLDARIEREGLKYHAAREIEAYEIILETLNQFGVDTDAANPATASKGSHDRA